MIIKANAKKMYSSSLPKKFSVSKSVPLVLKIDNHKKYR